MGGFGKAGTIFLFTNHLNVNSVCINHSLKSQVPDPAPVDRVFAALTHLIKLFSLLTALLS